MPLYQIASLLIDSGIVLPCVATATNDGGAWRFTIDRRGTPPKRCAWYHHQRAAGRRVWRSLARRDGSHVVRFWRQASFVVSPAIRRITCYPAATTSVETVRQLLLAHVLPLLFADAGAVALHASAVRTPAGVVTFVGETRGGKSTIAAALSARGYPLVADDCAIVELVRGECLVRPMHVGLRLWPDTMRMFARAGRTPKTAVADEGKARITAHTLGFDVCNRPAPLHRIYLLESARSKRPVTIEPVSRPDAVVALLTSSFQLEMDRPAQVRLAFDRLSTVASRVPVRRLRRPRGLAHLPTLVDRVLEDVASEYAAG
jgi:hypothetical protein